VPRSLTARLAAAFVILALAVLLAVGASLFVVLRGLHSEAQQSAIVDLVETTLPQARASAIQGDLRGALGNIEDYLGSRGVTAYLLTADNRLRGLDGAIAGAAPADLANPGGVRGTSDHGVTTFPDGQRYAWAESTLRAGAALGPRALVFAQLDDSGRRALGDLVVALPLISLVTALVGGGLGLAVSRSISGPISRLARRATSLPASPDAELLPLEGPTEVRELTAAFNSTAAELADSRRHETELLANLRHDLRTPLTVIGGFATALVDGVATGERARQAARAIDEETSRLERLVDELGSIERLRAGSDGLRPEPLEPGAVLASAVERFADRARAAGLDLAMSDRLSDGVAFAADRLAVERMLGNLVTNAIAAFQGEPGHVWLEARQTWLRRPAGESGSAAEGDAPAIALSVIDDGPGFPAGSAGHVFERFYRADPARTGGGSGLGLAIVRDLARAHGGDAIAENVVPHGARVSIVLPVVASPAVS
jgi:signal transduction histidine kinase